MSISLSLQGRKNIASSLRGQPRMGDSYNGNPRHFIFVDNRVPLPNGTTYTMFDYLQTCLNYSGNDGAIAGANKQYVLGTYFSPKTDMPSDFNVLDDGTLSYVSTNTFVARNSGTIGSVLILRNVAYASDAILTAPIQIASGGSVGMTLGVLGIGEGVTLATYNAGSVYSLSSENGVNQTMVYQNGTKSTIVGSNSDTIYSQFTGCTDSVGVIGSGSIFEFSSLSMTAGATYTFGGMSLKINKFV